MNNMRVEFTINANDLGRIVLLVEEMGASDFTFAVRKVKSVKSVTKPPPKASKKTAKKKMKMRKRMSGGPRGGATDAVLKILELKGTAHRSELAAAVVKSGGSEKTISGLLWRLERQGQIKATKRGSGIFVIAGNKRKTAEPTDGE